MELDPDHGAVTPTGEHVRQVQLPSGKVIEVVYFEGRPVDTAPAPHEDELELHVCGTCSAELTYPVAWEEEGPSHWRVTLRCPNCEWEGTGVFAQATVDRFDAELDRGTEAMVRDLKRLMTANMQADIERFVTALERDHVLPSDF